MIESYQDDESIKTIKSYLLFILVVLPAFIVRYYLFTLHPPLWLDEAMLALNINARNFLELVKPLDYDQGAPLGYLWLVKLATMIFGANEFGLRAISLISGGLSLFLLTAFSAKVNGIAGRFFAVAAIAISFPIISYSVQVKQYSLDLFITLLIYLVAETYFRETEPSKDYFRLGLFGAIVPWFSHPSVFSLAGLGIVLLLNNYKKEKRKGKRALLLALAAWASSFIILYLLQYRGLASNNTLTNYWAEYFMPFSAQTPGWIYDRIAELLRMPGGLSAKIPYWVVVLLFVGGAATLWQRKNRWVVLFSISFLLTIIASALEKYPFGGRLALFLLPGMMICLGASLDLFVIFTRRYQLIRTVIAFVAAFYLLSGSLWVTIENTINPKNTENITQTMQFLEDNYRSGDVIYLYHFSVPVFEYYAEEFGLDNATLIKGSDHSQGADGYDREIRALAGENRVWFLFSHLVDDEYIGEAESIIQVAGDIGNVRKTFIQPGTAISLYLYDLSPN